MSPPDPPPTWPPPSGLTTPLVPRASTILPISARIHIAAPAPLVFAILLDTSTYPTWNTFCPTAIIHSHPPNPSSPSNPALLRQGTSFTLNVLMNPAHPTALTPTQLRITDLSTPTHPSAYIPASTLAADATYTADLSRVYRVAWASEGGFVARGLRTERFHEVISLTEEEGGGCEVRTWECQGGVLARAVKWKYGGVLGGKFEVWCRDLGGEAERRVREGEGG